MTSNGKWISIEERLPSIENGIFRVKLNNDDEIKSYFHKDQMFWQRLYTGKSGYWWNDEKPLYNVTHWLEKIK